jgi:hypothetical protein
MYSICRCCCCYHNIVWIYFYKTFCPNPTFHAFSVPFKSRWTSWSIPSINSICFFFISYWICSRPEYRLKYFSISNNQQSKLMVEFKIQNLEWSWNVLSNDNDNYIFIYLDYIPSPMKMKSSRACLSSNVFFSPGKSSCINIISYMTLIFNEK